MGSVACLAECNSGVIHVLDISDPTAVTQDGECTRWQDYQQVEIVGNVLYAGRGHQSGEWTFTIFQIRPHLTGPWAELEN